MCGWSCGRESDPVCRPETSSVGSHRLSSDLLFARFSRWWDLKRALGGSLQAAGLNPRSRSSFVLRSSRVWPSLNSSTLDESPICWQERCSAVQSRSFCPSLCSVRTLSLKRWRVSCGSSSTKTSCFLLFCLFCTITVKLNALWGPELSKLL